MSEVDPDPYVPGEGHGESVLGGSGVGGREKLAGDPTDGGRHGEIGAAPSVTSDEPDDGGPGFPVGGGTVGEEPDAPPVADPGPDA